MTPGARSGNLHSRVVAWLKVVLPLLALVILSTLFLVSRSIDPEDAIPYAQVDVEDRIREPRMTSPSYSGVTSDGASLTVTADEARPAQGADAGSAAALEATLVTPQGAESRFRAATSTLDSRAQQLDLGGGVEIVTSDGFTITTENLVVALDKTDVKSGGSIAASGPLGDFTAGSMSLTQTGTPPGYVLLFQNRVKLIYKPSGIE